MLVTIKLYAAQFKVFFSFSFFANASTHLNSGTDCGKFCTPQAFYYPGSRAFLDFGKAQRMRPWSFRHLRRNVLLRYTLCS